MHRPAATSVSIAIVSAVLLLRGVSGDARQPQAQPTPAPLGASDPFTVAVNMTTIETAPIFVVADGQKVAGLRVINGGVRNVANGTAHAGTNAETQMLLLPPNNANVRLLLTVAEGLYRIVARRSAGISRLADLRGKRMTTPRNTSAHYHLVKMLATAGVAESEVTIIETPREGMAAAMAKGDADAISMWEPEAQNAVDALGRDAIVFQDNTVYRELFSLYASTDVLKDQRRRRELVAFVRALLPAAQTVRSRAADVMPLVARMIKQPETKVSASWTHHAFPVALPKDVLDVMTDEEQWIARMQNRQPRTRAELSALIDTSILDEARR